MAQKKIYADAEIYEAKLAFHTQGPFDLGCL